MLFRYTENPLRMPIFPPAELRVSAGPSGYTENSSFRYRPEETVHQPGRSALRRLPLFMPKRKSDAGGGPAWGPDAAKLIA